MRRSIAGAPEGVPSDHRALRSVGLFQHGFTVPTRHPVAKADSNGPSVPGSTQFSRCVPFDHHEEDVQSLAVARGAANDRALRPAAEKSHAEDRRTDIDLMGPRLTGG